MPASIFDIKHFAVHDGPGIRTTVFFKGCPLSCVWCHNPEGISKNFQLGYIADKCGACLKCADVCPHGAHIFSEDGGHVFARELCIACGECAKACPNGAISLYGKTVEVSDILPELLEDRDFYETSNGGVTLSGGECLLYADFCAELLRALKEQGIRTAVDTCGFVLRSALDKVMPYTDVFLYDIKAIDEDVHENCTGQKNALILKNLEYLSKCGKDIEIRIPYVPDYNSGEIEKIGEFLSRLQSIKSVKLLSYHNFAASKYESLKMKNTLPEKLPQESELSKARELLRSFGLNVE